MVLSSLFCLFCLFPGHGTGRRRVAGDQSEKIRLTFFGLRDFYLRIITISIARPCRTQYL